MGREKCFCFSLGAELMCVLRHHYLIVPSSYAPLSFFFARAPFSGTNLINDIFGRTIKTNNLFFSFVPCFCWMFLSAFIAPLMEERLTVSIRSLPVVVRDKIKRQKREETQRTRSYGTSKCIKLYANVTFISHFGNRLRDVWRSHDGVNFLAMLKVLQQLYSD